MTVSTAALAAGEATVSQTLLPGRSADAVVKIVNPNGFAVTLSSVTAAGAAVASNGCTPTGVSLVNATEVGAVIEAGSTRVVDLPGAVRMSSESASACQGATFTVPVLVAVRQ
jgi:Flp pilus assembly secretin CpaC